MSFERQNNLRVSKTHERKSLVISGKRESYILTVLLTRSKPILEILTAPLLWFYFQPLLHPTTQLFTARSSKNPELLQANILVGFVSQNRPNESLTPTEVCTKMPPPKNAKLHLA
jgi:hypothetical protein